MILSRQHPGVVVIDVSDPTNPRPTAYLDDTPAALNPHENLKVNQAREAPRGCPKQRAEFRRL